MLLLVGLPAFFVELTAGQYARYTLHTCGFDDLCDDGANDNHRVGANKVWGRMVPAFKGLGYGMLLVE